MNDNPKWQVARLDEIERRGRGIPVREHLGIHSFGVNAFRSDEDGTLINEHDEAGGQEELYLVLDGTATFEIDGETVDAPAGTFLAVSPEVRRHAVAAETGTEVLALGGPATFEPAASEWIEQARPHMRDRPARARAILDELRRERPDSPGLRFGEALLAAAQGDASGARMWLAAAIEREPLLRGEAAGEPLLAPLVPEIS